MRILQGIAVGLLWAPHALYAQGAPERRIDFDISSVLSYDSNVVGVSSALIRPGESRDDVRFTPSANIDLYLPIGRQAVFLAGSIGYDFYRNNKRLESERIGLRGGVDLALGRICSVTLAYDFRRRQSDPGDILFRQALSNTQEDRSASADASCGSTNGLTATLGYRHDDTGNTTPFRQVQDYRADTINGSIGLARPTLGSLSVYGSYRNGTYPNRAPLPGFPREEVRSYSGGLTYRRDIGTRLTGDVSVGYTDVSSNQPFVPDFSGLSWSAALDYRAPGDRAFVTLALSRASEQSNLLSVSYTITDNYSIGGTYAISDRLTFDTGISYRNRKLRQSPFPGAVTLGDNDNLLRTSAGLTYRAPRGIGLGLSVGAERRRADNDSFSYRSFFTSLTSRYSF